MKHFFFTKKIILSVFSLLSLSCTQDNAKPLSGYIEGQYTYIASGIAGTLFSLNVTRGQTIAKDTLLFTLDPEPDKSAMEASYAQAEELVFQVALSKIQLSRYKDLYANHATDKNTLDEKQTDFDSKTKQLLSAKKTFAESQWAFQQKIIHAPVSGYVNDTFYRLGEKVAANQPVLAMLTPDNIKVLFYIPEEKLSTIRLGQVITFNCDGCDSKTKATIEYISSEAEYTPPIIYSQDTRYKLVYLVRANMPSDTAKRFHPGQPLDIFLHE